MPRDNPHVSIFRGMNKIVDSNSNPIFHQIGARGEGNGEGAGDANLQRSRDNPNFKSPKFWLVFNRIAKKLPMC